MVVIVDVSQKPRMAMGKRMRRREEGVHKEPRKIYLTSQTLKRRDRGGDTAALPEREDAAEVSETKVSPTQVRNALAGLGDASTGRKDLKPISGRLTFLNLNSDTFRASQSRTHI